MPTAYPTELKVKTICRYEMKVSLPHQVLYSTNIIPGKLHLFLADILFVIKDLPDPMTASATAS